MAEVLPEGYQRIYVAYPGDGSQIYFTAASDYEARKFLEAEHPEASSSFRTALLLKSKGSYGFRHGIMSLTWNKDILKDE